MVICYLKTCICLQKKKKKTDIPWQKIGRNVNPDKMPAILWDSLKVFLLPFFFYRYVNTFPFLRVTLKIIGTNIYIYIYIH